MNVLKCTIKEQRLVASLQQVTSGTHIEHYQGPYEATPKTTAQVLETNKKFMDNDVTIKKIPFYEVGNNHGGTTITIGKEI